MKNQYNAIPSVFINISCWTPLITVLHIALPFCTQNLFVQPQTKVSFV